MSINTSSDKVTTAGWGALFAGVNKYKVIVLAVAVLLNVSNIYITATVLPTIVKEIGGLRFYSWNTSLFEIASIVGAVYSAKLFAAAGPGKAYQAGLLLFMAGSAVCAAAPVMEVLLMGRLIQGLGGGLLFALSYAMIRIIFEERLWARVMALISAMWGAGAFVGPFIGGIFAEHGSWRLGFVSILVLAAGLLVLARYSLPQKHTEGKSLPVSWFKLVLLVLVVLMVSIGSIYEGLTINLFFTGLAVLFLAALVMAENRKGIKLLPTGAYNLRTLLGSSYLVMILFSLVAAVEIFIPYFLQVIYGYSPLQSGYLAVLIALGWSLSSMGSAGIPVRHLGKLTVIAAILLMAGLYGLMLVAHEQATVFEMILLGLALLAIGTGLGLVWPHLSVRILSSAPAGEEERTSASITIVQLITMTLGAAFGGLVANYNGMTLPGGLAGAKSASVALYGFFMICPLLVLLLLLLHKNFRDNMFRGARK
ncbi:MFS transporter [Taibaiella chishuiensis]|uniref:Putative MFS family arabinose efflux permease n=1 Tax=Taibaiella chishuiensis TaxID=1434707 RepID=A0A2P8D2T6_9BACT|nr:MFS transporter [Taibaiella chishuiensis]PSK91540.1 putative MFS family arabinose efflux permease [Taibaiella chishuiensis]